VLPTHNVGSSDGAQNKPTVKLKLFPIGLDGGIREVAQQGLDAETAMAQLMTVMRVALAQRQQSFCEAEAGRPSMIEGRAIACF